jgi:hypothetical protein
MTTYTPAQIIARHMELSGELAELRTQYEAAAAIYNAKLERLEDALDAMLKAEGSISILTPHGKATRVVKTMYVAKDMGAVHNFMLRTGNMDLLQRRIKQEAVVDYLEEHGELPDGITTNSKYECKISKLTKAEMEKL